MPAKPYFKPAIEEHSTEVMALIVSAVGLQIARLIRVSWVEGGGK